MMKSTVKIIGIKDETHDVKTFLTTKPDGFDYLPGQYVIINQKALVGESRPLTMASSPTQSDLLFTVKRTGDFTGMMFKMKKGDDFSIKGPFGEMLNFDDQVASEVVFVAGGSGITPSLASLRYALDKGMKNDFTLLYSNKEQRDIICRKELDMLSSNLNLKLVYCLTREEPDGWTGEIGRIDKNIIDKYIQNPTKRLWYICAPPPMVEAMKKTLQLLGVGNDKIKTETWQLPAKG
jgi:glycine betaine catabolism B